MNVLTTCQQALSYLNHAMGFFKYFLGLEEADIEHLVNLREEYLSKVIVEEDETFEEGVQEE